MDSAARFSALSPLPSDIEPPRGPQISLTAEEGELFHVLRRAREEANLTTTLRVAGGWVRDKLLATSEFNTEDGQLGGRLTAKFKPPKSGRSPSDPPCPAHAQPVDIDIALDDMLGRAFAEVVNDYLEQTGEETHGVGVVLQNPEKSKHLETATMKVGTFWIDFVNLRAEEYTQNSRIPGLMRIGSPDEDAFRRDLTINALFYNINSGEVEDWTGQGLDHLRQRVVATPLAPLTTLLDDPLRVLRSVRFASRLRFQMDRDLTEAAQEDGVREALAGKVSRERIGNEVDLMLQSPEPVGAMRLLVNLKLAHTVFLLEKFIPDSRNVDRAFHKGLVLLAESSELLADSRVFPPSREDESRSVNHNIRDINLREDEELRRLLWYAAFLKPLRESAEHVVDRRGRKKARRTTVCRILIDHLKRPVREAEAIEKIMEGADEFSRLMKDGGPEAAASILLNDIRVENDSNAGNFDVQCYIGGNTICGRSEDHPMWRDAMQFRLACARTVVKMGHLWRAALLLSLSDGMADGVAELSATSAGDDQVQDERLANRLRNVERYNAAAAAMWKIGVVGIWAQKPLMDGQQVKKVLPKIPVGPGFRKVLDEQETWMMLNPGGETEHLEQHLAKRFPEYL